jgi:hypothetical protein
MGVMAQLRQQAIAKGLTTYPVCVCGQQIPSHLWDAHQAGCAAVTEEGFAELDKQTPR